MKRTAATVTGFVLCVLLGALDIVGVLGAGMDDAPPLGIVITGAVLGGVTLAAAVPTWRGNRTAGLFVLASRALSVLLSIPAFFTDGVSGLVLGTVTVTIVLTVLGVALLAPAVRTDRAAVAS